MVQSWKELAPGRYRETFGRYFEDFRVGDVYEHRPGKTVTEQDNHLFTLLTLIRIPSISTQSSAPRASSAATSS